MNQIKRLETVGNLSTREGLMVLKAVTEFTLT